MTGVTLSKHHLGFLISRACWALVFDMGFSFVSITISEYSRLNQSMLLDISYLVTTIRNS